MNAGYYDGRALSAAPQDGAVRLGFLPSIILPFLLTIASISRLPLFEQSEPLKYIIAACEFASVGVMFIHVHDKRRALFFAIVGVFFILLRFAFASSIALIEFGQPFLLSFQEARFGVMLAFMPVTYYFFKWMDKRSLAKFALYLIGFIAVLDFVVFVFLAPDQSLVLGERTYQRYVCSTLFPLSAACMLVSRPDAKQQDVLTAVIVCTFLFLHALLITTSRIETFLTLSVLCYCLSQWVRALPQLVFSVALIAVVAVLLFSGDAVEFNGEVAGRNYSYAFSVAVTAFPYGYGFVTDAIMRNALAVSDQYYSSDYGMLLYVLRYGVPGVVFSLGLIGFWISFFVAGYHRTGILFIAAAFLAYILFIPILDYSSFAGGAVLSTMAILSKDQSRRYLAG